MTGRDATMNAAAGQRRLSQVSYSVTAVNSLSPEQSEVSKFMSTARISYFSTAVGLLLLLYLLAACLLVIAVTTVVTCQCPRAEQAE